MTAPRGRHGLTPQARREMAHLARVWPDSREQVAAAFGVSVKTLANAKAEFPVTDIIWKGQA